MSKLKMKQPFTVLILLVLLALAGCNNSGTDKSKELELKEKELELKEKELELKEKASEDDSEKAEKASEDDSEKAEKTESIKKVYTPEKDSAARNQIMDTLRTPVQKELKQNVIFKVNDLKVSGDWAFMGGEPLAKSGGKPDYRGTKYEEDSDMFDNNIFALLKKKGGRWTIVVYYIGCTDVCYAGWWKEHGAPKEIFPYTE